MSAFCTFPDFGNGVYLIIRGNFNSKNNNKNHKVFF